MKLGKPFPNFWVSQIRQWIPVVPKTKTGAQVDIF